jgi:hypothetical protein
MPAVLIDFATRKASRPFRDPNQPRGPISHEVRATLRSRWCAAHDFVVAARHERDAARLRVNTVRRDDPGFHTLDAARWRTWAAYDEARIVLMKTPSWSKQCVRWKWTQLTNLAARQSELEDVLDADEDWLGMTGDRPPPPPVRKLEALLVAADHTVESRLDRVQRNLELIREHLARNQPPASSSGRAVGNLGRASVRPSAGPLQLFGNLNRTADADSPPESGFANLVTAVRRGAGFGSPLFVRGRQPSVSTSRWACATRRLSGARIERRNRDGGNPDKR